MNAYVLLAVFAVILVAILAFGVRLITNALRGRREASAVARRTGPASDYYARTLRQADRRPSASEAYSLFR
jgi:hypothetical protein